MAGPIAGWTGNFVLGKYNLTSYLNKVTPTNATDKADTSVLGTQYKSSVPGQYAAGFGLTGWFDPAAGGYSEAVSAYMAGSGTGTPTPAILCFPTTGPPALDPAFLLNGWVGTKNLDVAVTGAVPLVTEVNGQGAMDSGYLQSTVAQSVALTTTLGEVNNGAATTNGWAAILSVHGITGAAPSVVVTIEHSAAGSGVGFSTVCTFATKTAVGFEYKTGTDNPVKQWTRALVTFGGTTATFVFTIAFARK